MSIWSPSDQSTISSMSSPPPLLPHPRKGVPMIVQAPRLEVENLDLEPFSNTFSGLFGGLAFDLHEQHSLDPEREMSYDIQNYTNLSEWDDDDIDEILVMMPKKFPTALSTIPEDLEPSPTIAHHPTLSDFDILQPSQVQSQFQITRKTSTTTLCQSRATGKLLTLKSKRVDSQALCCWPEQLVLECMRDLSSMQGHTPFIPYLHAAFLEGEQMYLVLDPALTLTLRGLVGRHNGLLAPEAVLFYASEIAMAISALHSAGVMHRDLSPSSVMVDGEGHILLTSFGCAEFFGPSRSCSSNGNRLMAELASSESKDYHAPEIFLGWTHDSAVDCWGFGMLLYFMFLGTHPFRSGDDVEVEDPQLKDKVLQGSIPSDMLCAVEFRARDLIVKCLERNPVGRPDVESIKEHAYFSRTSWEVVASKRSKVPVLPQPISGRTIIRKKSAFEKAASLTPFRSVALDPKPLADWMTRTIVPQLPEIFRSSMSILPQDKDSGTPVSAVEGQALSVEDAGREEEEAAETNSTERRARFWDTLDREGGLSANKDVDRGSVISDVVPQPMKLRRQRSMIYPQQLLASLSTTSLQIQNKLRNRRMTRSKTKSTSALRRQCLQELELELPVGIEQIGNGIGFTYNLPVVTASSKASICTSAPRTCYGRALQQLGFGLGLGLGFDTSNRNIKGHERTKRTSKIKPREREQQQDSNSNSTSRFLKDMYRCPSWILSTPFSIPSPLALTVANSGSETTDVHLNGNLGLPSSTSDSAEGSLPMSIGSTLTWESILDGNSNSDAASPGSNSDPTSPSSNSGLGSSSDPTSPSSLSQHSDDETGPFTPTTIACAEEASVPKFVELAAAGDGHMDVVDVESTLRLVTSSGLRLSFLGV